MRELRGEFDKEYMFNLREFLIGEMKMGKNILPEPKLWFNALNITPLDSVKVVIIGQDPYPTIGHPHGLSFSVLPDVKPLPKSLYNIFTEMRDDIGIDNFHTGYLEPWAKQGVLLLNSILTVEAGRTNSHKNIGWEIFTDRIIDILNSRLDGVIFMLWGLYAQRKGERLDSSRHLILKSPTHHHSLHLEDFLERRPFSKANSYLIEQGKSPIEWRL